MNAHSVQRWLLTRRRVESLLSLYAVGLLLSSYYPLVLTVGSTRVLRPDWVLFIPLFAYVAYSIVTSDDSIAVHSRGSVFVIGALAVFAVSAAVNHLYVPFDAFTHVAQFVYVVTLFSCVSYLRVDRRTLLTVFQVSVVLMSVIGLYVVYQSIALNHGLPFWNPYFSSASPTRTMFETHGYNRPAGLFSEPRWLSGFYLPGIAFLVGVLSKDSGLLWSRRADFTALGIVLLAFALTASMAGYLSLTALFVFGILLPWTRRGSLKIAIGFYASMVLLVAILSVFGSGFATMIIARTTKILDILLAIASKLGDVILPDWSNSDTPRGAPDMSTTTSDPPSGDTSTSTTTTSRPPDSESHRKGSTGVIASHLSGGSIGVRAARALTGIQAWLSNPLFGVGPGQFQHWAHANNVTKKFPVQFASPLDELNSFWLQALVTGGILGFTAISAVWAEILSKLRRAFQYDLDDRQYLPACVLVLLVLLVDGFWGIGIVHPLRWFFPALVYSYVSKAD